MRINPDNVKIVALHWSSDDQCWTFDVCYDGNTLTLKTEIGVLRVVGSAGHERPTAVLPMDLSMYGSADMARVQHILNQNRATLGLVTQNWYVLDAG